MDGFCAGILEQTMGGQEPSIYLSWISFSSENGVRNFARMDGFCAGILEQTMGGQEPSRNGVVVPARQAT